MRYGGWMRLFGLVAAGAVAAAALPGCSMPPKNNETARTEQRKRLKRMEERMNSLEDKVDRLDQKVSMVAVSVHQRLKRLKEDKNTSSSSSSTETEPGTPENSRRESEMSPRVKNLYRPEAARKTVHVRGVSYRKVQQTLRHASKDSKKKLVEQLKGTIVNWTGWVQKVETKDGKASVTLNMYKNPDMYPSATVTFTVPDRIGQRLQKGEKIGFTGQIESIDPQFGAVTLGRAQVWL